MKLKNFIIWFLAIFVALGLPVSGYSQEPLSDAVYVIPVTGVIDQGLAKFVRRGIDEACRTGARAIIINIDTPGGEVQAASGISDAILSSSVPTISFVNKDALSAGVIVAISSEAIAMAPGSTIGAAETRPREEKYISAWSKKLQTVAEIRERDKQLVAAMADADIVIEGLKEKGKILTLTGNEAIELGLADTMAKNVEEVLAWQDLNSYEVISFTPNWAERISFIATNPYTAPIMLTIGIVGALMEIFTPGFGIPGACSLIAFSLFFGGNFLAGAAQSWVLGLFIIGLFLLAIEMFIPGFGVFGVAGILALVGSIIIAFPSPEQAFVSFAISLVASIIIMYLLTKYLIKTPAFGRIVLGEKQGIEEGYTVSAKNAEDIIGMEGVSLTPLRPAGTAQIGLQKYDVLADGAFIPQGTPVVVLSVEGNKIVVTRKERV